MTFWCEFVSKNRWEITLPLADTDLNFCNAWLQLELHFCVDSHPSLIALRPIARSSSVSCEIPESSDVSPDLDNEREFAWRKEPGSWQKRRASWSNPNNGFSSRRDAPSSALPWTAATTEVATTNKTIEIFIMILLIFENLLRKIFQCVPLNLINYR